MSKREAYDELKRQSCAFDEMKRQMEMTRVSDDPCKCGIFTSLPHAFMTGEKITIVKNEPVTLNLAQGENKMDEQTKKIIEDNCKKPLYILMQRTAAMDNNLCDLQYTTSKKLVSDCLLALGLVFELKDGRLEPVTSITVP